MDTSHGYTRFRYAGASRAAFSLVVRILTGLVLLVIAALIAFVTAFAGLALAAAALLMRFSFAARGERRMKTEANGSDITLEARPTPRGWTVET